MIPHVLIFCGALCGLFWTPGVILDAIDRNTDYPYHHGVALWSLGWAAFLTGVFW